MMLAPLAAAALAVTVTAPAPTMAETTTPAGCTAAAYGASNLSGFRLAGGADHPHFEHSKNTTRAGCLEACCGIANCTAWNYHLSSADPSHNVQSCWLSTDDDPLVTLVSLDPAEPAAADVWVGGSKRSVTCQGGCEPRRRMPEIPECDGTDYSACRKNLWKYVFNTTTGELPTKAKPDYVTDLPDWEMKGFPGPGQASHPHLDTPHIILTSSSPHPHIILTSSSPHPGQGTGVGNVSWKMGLQKLVWEIGRPGGGMRDGMLRLNSTVTLLHNLPLLAADGYF